MAGGDEFCESCGARLHAVPHPMPSFCPKCGAGADLADPDGYCGQCGFRLARPTDHIEIEVDTMAAVSDKGHRHHRNEDSVALRVGHDYRVVVVCDGVSTTANPDQASAAAAVAAADEIEAALLSGVLEPEEVRRAIADAVAVAQKAVLVVPADEPGGYTQAPSTTMVASVIVPGGIVTTNVGDSRAYWIDASSDGGRSRQLTHDDSLAEAAIARGMSPEEAYAARDAHTITHWLGADAPALDPHTQVVVPDRVGTLIVCSDGLWNYFESPEALRELLGAGGPGETPLHSGRRLVQAALDAGGADNVTVAVVPVGDAPERVVAEPTLSEPVVAEPAPSEPAVPEPAPAVPAVPEPAPSEPVVPEPAPTEPAQPKE